MITDETEISNIFHENKTYHATCGTFSVWLKKEMIMGH